MGCRWNTRFILSNAPDTRIREHCANRFPQRTGLGRQLMGYYMDVADNIPSIEKAMLTCFVSNKYALKFYEKLGFTKDDYSPRERKLRGGKVVIPDYVILSRPTAAKKVGDSRAHQPGR